MVGSLYSWVFGAPKIENNLKAPDKGDIDELYKVMREAESYDEWKGAADKLDVIPVPIRDTDSKSNHTNL
eukprot:3250381-Rhodomonas_salina.1